MGQAAERGGVRKVSKQRIWQIKQRKQGKCIRCGKAANGARYCKKHAALVQGKETIDVG
jgi:hypothetical protein